MKAVLLLLAFIYSANAQSSTGCPFQIQCQNGGVCKQPKNPLNNFWCYCTPGFSGQFCTDKTTLTASTTAVNVGGSVTFTCVTTIFVDPSVNNYVFELYRQPAGGVNAIDGSAGFITSTNGGGNNPVSWVQSRTLNAPGVYTFTCRPRSGSNVANSGISNAVTVTVGQSSQCANKDCNNGNCVVEGNVAVCKCDDGWWGANCNQRDLCKDIKCQNGGTCSKLAASPFYQCACPKGYSGNFCQIVAVGAPCTTSKQCKGTQCGAANLEGYCKVPEFTCQCQSDQEPSCKKHTDCHSSCATKFGLCMKDNTCNCFSNIEQMFFFMNINNFPQSPPFVAH